MSYIKNHKKFLLTLLLGCTLIPSSSSAYFWQSWSKKHTTAAVITASTLGLTALGYYIYKKYQQFSATVQQLNKQISTLSTTVSQQNKQTTIQDTEIITLQAQIAKLYSQNQSSPQDKPHNEQLTPATPSSSNLVMQQQPSAAQQQPQQPNANNLNNEQNPFIQKLFSEKKLSDEQKDIIRNDADLKKTLQKTKDENYHNLLEVTLIARGNNDNDTDKNDLAQFCNTELQMTTSLEFLRTHNISLDTTTIRLLNNNDSNEILPILQSMIDQDDEDKERENIIADDKQTTPQQKRANAITMLADLSTHAQNTIEEFIQSSNESLLTESFKINCDDTNSTTFIDSVFDTIQPTNALIIASYIHLLFDKIKNTEMVLMVFEKMMTTPSCVYVKHNKHNECQLSPAATLLMFQNAFKCISCDEILQLKKNGPTPRLAYLHDKLHQHNLFKTMPSTILEIILKEIKDNTIPERESKILLWAFICLKEQNHISQITIKHMVTILNYCLYKKEHFILAAWLADNLTPFTNKSDLNQNRIQLCKKVLATYTNEHQKHTKQFPGDKLIETMFQTLSNPLQQHKTPLYPI